ncbi:hypothetical protein GIB67_036463 [Kingdonia uniflora]|uniref:beta-galactosidase n=1 Tax=Kingdonia uniflora TaxID=39325 RepID=A0A7J7MH49_9MAGN|nr:hypothetical protein GIB67_036463 [Kingdonia uniflora]
MNVMGSAGKAYIQWCAEMATDLNVGVPWIMCQQNDAPQPMINTCNGFDCDTFKPNNPNSPKMWTENWTGWFKAWGNPDPHRTAEDLSYAVAKFFQAGGVLQNYYMYHGGTNFGRTSGGPYITSSYDYDAPLDEYAGNASVCFIANNNKTNDQTVELQDDGKFFAPAWSISILEGCNKEIYNTAKVNTQTSVIVKKPNQVENNSQQLSWSWRPEPLKDTLAGVGSFSATKLIEQKETTADVSDYLWYMTRFQVKYNKKGNMSNTKGITIPATLNSMILRVNTTGQVLHAYVNKKLVRSKWGTNGKYRFVFEAPITLKKSKHQITLLSATVGLKTTFKAPLGRDPVVVDMQSMGKGHTWVNGHSIGRFWPSILSKQDGCSATCDYRGQYGSDKCSSNCGSPSQRWYHVPRSFLNDGVNTLVLFEEIGGNPSQVNFQTVTVGKACGNAYKGSTLELSCQGGQKISAIEFASFGDPKGSCGFFEKGTSESDTGLSTIQKACVGKESCAINVSEATLGSSKCSGIVTKRFQGLQLAQSASSRLNFTQPRKDGGFYMKSDPGASDGRDESGAPTTTRTDADER